jgi:hypothetical protein
MKNSSVVKAQGLTPSTRPAAMMAGADQRVGSTFSVASSNRGRNDPVSA